MFKGDSILLKLLDVCGLSEFFCSPDSSPLETRRKGTQRRQATWGFRWHSEGWAIRTLEDWALWTLRDIAWFLRATEELSSLPCTIS